MGHQLSLIKAAVLFGSYQMTHGSCYSFWSFASCSKRGPVWRVWMNFCLSIGEYYSWMIMPYSLIFLRKTRFMKTHWNLAFEMNGFQLMMLGQHLILAPIFWLYSTAHDIFSSSPEFQNLHLTENHYLSTRCWLTIRNCSFHRWLPVQDLRRFRLIIFGPVTLEIERTIMEECTNFSCYWKEMTPRTVWFLISLYFCSFCVSI